MARKNKNDKGNSSAAPVAEAEAVEEVAEGGMGIDDGIVLTTTVLLIGAVVLVYLSYQIYAV